MNLLDFSIFKDQSRYILRKLGSTILVMKIYKDKTGVLASRIATYYTRNEMLKQIKRE